jgi:hypothetical protein
MKVRNRRKNTKDRKRGHNGAGNSGSRNRIVARGPSRDGKRGSRNVRTRGRRRANRGTRKENTALRGRVEGTLRGIMRMMVTRTSEVVNGTVNITMRRGRANRALRNLNRDMGGGTGANSWRRSRNARGAEGGRQGSGFIKNPTEVGRNGDDGQKVGRGDSRRCTSGGCGG